MAPVCHPLHQWRGRDRYINRERKPPHSDHGRRSRSAPPRSVPRARCLSTARCRPQTPTGIPVARGLHRPIPTYNATTGLTPFTGYATDFTTPGTNVAVTAAANVPSSVNVNAIQSTGTFATTITAGLDAWHLTSGMLLNISGTRTFTGGTIAFGANPLLIRRIKCTSTVAKRDHWQCRADQRQACFHLSRDLSGLTGTDH